MTDDAEGTTELWMDARLGGLVAERTRTAEASWGTITEIRPGTVLEFTGSIGLGELSYSTVRYNTVETAGERCLLTVVHQALGLFGQGTYTSYDHGWADLNERLKLFVETGERRGANRNQSGCGRASRELLA